MESHYFVSDALRPCEKIHAKLGIRISLLLSSSTLVRAMQGSHRLVFADRACSLSLSEFQLPKLFLLLEHPDNLCILCEILFHPNLLLAYTRGFLPDFRMLCFSWLVVLKSMFMLRYATSLDSLHPCYNIKWFFKNNLVLILYFIYI